MHPVHMSSPENSAHCNACWWHFEHSADVGVAAAAPTLAGVFEQIALAMTAVVTTAPVAACTPVEVCCDGADAELLLVDWLNALIFEMATRGLVFGRFDVAIGPHGLSATAFGEALDRSRHQPAVELKGATYTALSVDRDEAGCWQARCVVDV